MRRIVKILKTIASMVYRTPPSYAILSKTSSAYKTFAVIHSIPFVQRFLGRLAHGLLSIG